MKETACSEAPASSNVEPASPGTASSQVSCSSGREKVRWKLGKLLGRGSFASRMKVKKSRIGFLLYVHPAHKVVVVVVLTESADFTIAKKVSSIPKYGHYHASWRQFEAAVHNRTLQRRSSSSFIVRVRMSSPLASLEEHVGEAADWPVWM